jgi:hypothetical protein
MFKTHSLFGLFICLSVLQAISHVRSEPNGGQVAKMISYNNSFLLPGYSIELVNLSKSNSPEKEFRIYVLNPDSQPVNLMGSGYWKVSWLLGNKQGQLQDNLGEEKQNTWNEKPPYTPLHSFVAKGNILKDRNLKIEVVIALPGKGGTGMAVFYPFRSL